MLRTPRLRPALASLCAAALAAACAGPPAAPEVDPASERALPAGDVVGFTGPYGSHAWKGIPFAAPPVGALRWRAPQPAPRWDGVRQALASGSACPQFASVFAGEGRDAEGVIGDEDCLYLDVYAPRSAPDAVPAGDARLPVMLWIHGGGNSIGFAGFYDGGNLAATHDVVVVAVNYRLGPLGWLRHRALRASAADTAEASGNFAVLDHIRALEWVQENIAAFGGDPGNVTIFGESAGGRNVLSLLLAPRAEGLFHRAVIQSGGGFQDPTPVDATERFVADADDRETHPQSANEVLARLLVRDGTVADRAAAVAYVEGASDAELEAYLRARSPQELLEAYLEDPSEPGGGMIWFPNPLADGTVLPAAAPMDLLARGAYHRVPVILGTNRDENKLFMAFDEDLARFRFGLFPAPHDADRYDAHSDALARAWKARSVDAPADVMRRVQGPTVFAYRWDWDEEPGIPLLYDGARMFGASHGLEIPFVFGHWDLGPDTNLLFGGGSEEGRLALSAQMMSYWAEFAYAGAPGRGRDGALPEWRAWDPKGERAPRYLVLDTPADGGVRMASATERPERIVADVVADERFGSARHRCAALRQLAQSEYVERGVYDTAGDGLCGAYAMDDFPWEDAEDVAAR